MIIIQLTINGISENLNIQDNDLVWIEDGISSDAIILFDSTINTVLPDLGINLANNPQISQNDVM